MRLGQAHENAHASRSLDSVLQELRNRGVRVTNQRRAILDYMMHTRAHPTVEEIYYDLSQTVSGMSLATVYNNLRVLVEQGLVHEMKFGDVTSHYDYLGHDHYHIQCQQCGKISDFELDLQAAIHQQAREQTGYLVDRVEVEAYGLCPECQAQNAKSSQ